MRFGYITQKVKKQNVINNLGKSIVAYNYLKKIYLVII